MPTPEIRQVEDAEQLSTAAAEECSRIMRVAIGRQGRCTFVLSGGSTPRRLYELLAAPPQRDQIDWTRVDLFWGDERAVPPDHKDSNFRMANEALLQPLSIPATRIHRMPAERADRDRAAADYQAEIARVFDVPADGVPPAFDLVLLGLGPDGHTASLFPRTAALNETRRWVVPNHVPQLGTDRLTMTRVILNRAACIMFLVAGADKAAALAEVLEGPAESERLPAQLIRPETGRLVWLMDGAAAARLKTSTGTVVSYAQ
ncbi:MAG: 6-phosphogluconolactonase [Candidatus Binatia bacterium]